MADNETVDVSITNSVNGDSSEFDNFAAKKADSNAVISDDRFLKARIEELERQERELARENEEIKEVVERMSAEKEAAGKKISELEAAEAEHSHLEGKAMESVTKRAFELEGEVVRLQHDLGTALNAGDEAGREIERLMREIDELRREKSALSEKMRADTRAEVEELKSDYESKIGELEKKIHGLEEREREARRERAAAEERAKARLDELEGEIVHVQKEKTSLEADMGKLVAALKSSEEKVIQMAERIELLAKNTQESEEIIAGMVEKASQRSIDGIKEEAVERDAGLGGLKNKIPSPVVGAISAGVVVAVLAVCCVTFHRTR